MLVASRHALLFLAAFLCGVRSVHGGVVTLYYVSEPATTTASDVPSESVSLEVAGTTIASAIGPGDADMTRYEIQQIQSKLVLHEPETTVTYIDSPITVTYTVEQGATTAYNSVPPLATHESSGDISFSGIKQNCTLDISKNTGSCVEEDQIPSLVVSGDLTSTTIVTSSKTITGPLLPLATVTIALENNGGSSTGGTSDAIPNSSLVMAMQTTFLLGALLTITIF